MKTTAFATLAVVALALAVLMATSPPARTVYAQLGLSNTGPGTPSGPGPTDPNGPSI